MSTQISIHKSKEKETAYMAATLLIQGENDYATPTSISRALYTRPVESSVPTVNIFLPWTEHGFDLLLP